ncbi:MAG TPA: alpha/beta fold hydrolase [Xanthobacteraceae bacterium]|nr:alpha/beta fold hydrolase [Xanthobacteraceae bacterium]
MHTFSEGFVDANGVSLHSALAGAGRSVVLLHELGGTLNSWDGVVPRLAEHFRVLRYDQRGAGLSEKCDTNSPTICWSRISGR